MTDYNPYCDLCHWYQELIGMHWRNKEEQKESILACITIGDTYGPTWGRGRRKKLSTKGADRLKRKNKRQNGGRYRCHYCGQLSDTITIDHFIPKCRGGSDRVSNLRVCCYKCNQTKAKIDRMCAGLSRLSLAQLEYFDYPKSLEKILKNSTNYIQYLGCLFYPREKLGWYQ